MVGAAFERVRKKQQLLVVLVTLGVTVGSQPAVLQEVSIPIWSNTECRSKYGLAAPGGIVDHMICAGQASRDSCSVSTYQDDFRCNLENW